MIKTPPVTDFVDEFLRADDDPFLRWKLQSIDGTKFLGQPNHRLGHGRCFKIGHSPSLCESPVGRPLDQIRHRFTPTNKPVYILRLMFSM